jgi:hypothetical protein
MVSVRVVAWFNDPDDAVTLTVDVIGVKVLELDPHPANPIRPNVHAANNGRIPRTDLRLQPRAQSPSISAKPGIWE